MASSQMSAFLQHLRTTLDRDAGEVRDGELLTRFLKQRDDAALATLVQRHAPMVWGVCCRMLRNRHDAEDAFQATFLVLVRKAATVQDKELIANWLYGVASQTAVRLKAMAAKHGMRERQVMDTPEPAQTEASVDDLMPLLDQELNRLPEQFRALIVLCDLEGKTRKEVAQQLGCPEGTVASRLARARAMLAKRFARHGVAISGGALAVMLSSSALAAPTSVLVSAIKAASLLAAGQAATSGLISVQVVALTEGVVKAMFMNKIKSVLSMVFVGGMVLGGVGAGVGFSNVVAVAQTEGSTVIVQDLVALADPPAPVDAQRKEIEEKLQQLVKQLQELEAKKATLSKSAPPEPPKPALPATPAIPALGGGLQPPPGAMMQWNVLGQPANDPAIVALQGLLKSQDPKVVAQAKELLTLLTKKQPVMGGGVPFKLELVPGGKAELTADPAKPGTMEFQLQLDGLKSHANPKAIWQGESVRSTTGTIGSSALKLSADGKTAAVVGADGTITIYDVASGKEQMKFPVKK